MTTDAMPESVATAPAVTPAAPNAEQRVAETVLAAAASARIVLTAFLLAALLAWFVLLTMPKSHVRFHALPSGLHALLLFFLWLPVFIG